VADEISTARALVTNARHVVVLTGAGISTASGIPDFRGPEGVWTKDPHAEMLSSFDVWRSDPEVRRRAWRARVARRDTVRQPNDGHRALVQLERDDRLDLLITQNIDGLHHLAGSNPQLIVEIHGSEREAVCLRCGARQAMAIVLDRVALGDDDPHCDNVLGGTACGGLLKSSTISFGQSLVATDLLRSERASQHADLLLAVGSTLSVYPIANVVPTAKRAGAQIVIVNGQPTEMDDLADVVVRDDITVALPALVAD
jgi:NAD-dependent deacetylase